jgi:uncharacterized protein YlaI
MKCSYCKGKNLYLKRTSPMDQYGCRDCEKKIALLRKEGVSEKTIRLMFQK